MNMFKKNAILVGILYIIGTVTGILSVVFSTPLLGADYLVKVSANQNQFILATLFVLTMGFSLAFVPVLLFPIFKKINEALALAYVVFRGALETVTCIAMAIVWLFLLIFSQEYVKAGAPAASYFQTMGELFLKGHDSISTIVVFVFGSGALILYYLLYKSKLIPRWISIWGFIAIILHLTTGFLILFNLQSSFSTINSIMNFPILTQEMVMAVWLIAKGFNRAALTAVTGDEK